MIGNYGVPDRSLRDEFGLAKGFESDKIHASALLVQVLCLCGIGLLAFWDLHA